MNLRQLQKNDAKDILNAQTLGFGWPFSLTSPSGAVFSLVGRYRDIHLSEDAETGQGVSMRQVSVTFVTSEVTERVIPVKRATAAQWLVVAEDISGTFRVVDTMPDANFGITILILESVT